MTDLSLAAEFPAVDETEWLARVERVLKGASADTLVKTTLDGIEIRPLYAAGQTANPITRSAPQADEPAWQIVQRVDIPDPAQANAQLLEDLMGGATGVSLVLPQTVTAGAHGVALRGFEDLAKLFEGVELDLISVRIEAGRHARWLFPLLVQLFESRRLQSDDCHFRFAVDPLGDCALTGISPSLDAKSHGMGDWFDNLAWCQGPAFTADTRVYHLAGASPAQELAIMAATLVQYLRALQSSCMLQHVDTLGLSGDQLEPAAKQLGLLLTADADLFRTIAKLRAARLIWAQLLEAMELPHIDVWMDVETSLRMMARRDPHVNMLRVGAAVLAAGIGGADAVTALPMTAAMGLPDGFARRMARNSQLILQEESGIGRTLDAAAGSGYIESLTRDLAGAGWKMFQDIEARGGMAEALTSGHIASWLAETRQKRAALIGERRLGLTGVTEFPDLDERSLALLAIDVPQDWAAPDEDDEGERITCEPLPQMRDAEPYEALRDRADAHAAATRQRPKVFLATLGPVHAFTARATWVCNLFAVAGIEVTSGDACDSPDKAAEAFRGSGASVACLCSSDEAYFEMAADAAAALKQAGADYLYLAGDPANLPDNLPAAGVDEFLTQGVDIKNVLQAVQSRLGIDGA